MARESGARTARAVLSAFAAAVALALAAPSAHADASDDWSVWMGPNLTLSQPLGDFKEPNPDLAFGGGFTAIMLRTEAHLGMRFDMGLAGHGSQSQDVLIDDGFGGTVMANLETGSRLSWGMLGAQWDANPRGSGLLAYAMFGIVGWRPRVDAKNASGSDPFGRPESNRGFAWSAGLGWRIRPPNSKTMAIVTEVEYRARGAANYIGSPAYVTGPSGAEYNAVHSDITTLDFRLGVQFTKAQ